VWSLLLVGHRPGVLQQIGVCVAGRSGLWERAGVFACFVQSFLGVQGQSVVQPSSSRKQQQPKQAIVRTAHGIGCLTDALRQQATETVKDIAEAQVAGAAAATNAGIAARETSSSPSNSVASSSAATLSHANLWKCLSLIAIETHASSD